MCVCLSLVQLWTFASIFHNIEKTGAGRAKRYKVSGVNNECFSLWN